MTTDESGNEVPEAYPAVTFQLTRQVKDAAGKLSVRTACSVRPGVISSAEVQAAYDALNEGDKASGLVTLSLTFSDLDLYAPDGKKYQYTVTEIKNQLMGYDTWAAEGAVEASKLMSNTEAEDKVSISGLKPIPETDSDEETPGTGTDSGNSPEGGTDGENVPAEESEIQATFLNKQSEPPETYANFSATKEWQDYGDQFGFRPPQTADVSTGEVGYVDLLTLTRTAASQDGQENGMKEKVDFKVKWGQDGENDNTWTMTIIPVDGEAFEKYAPNGMPWTYTLSEPLTEDGRKLELNSEQTDADENKVYTPSQSDGVWPNEIKNSTAKQPSFGELTNSIQTSVWFEKRWMEAGEPEQEITEDYLGFDLFVTFKLQVAVNNGGVETWEDASKNEYVTKALGDQYEYEITVKARVDDDAWQNAAKNNFTGLPTVVSNEDDGGYIFLKYRVIETAVSYNGHVQTIEWESNNYKDPDAGLVDNAVFEQKSNTSISTNTLDTMEVSVKKVWNDGGNQYNTRPGANAPMTWTSWFVLQRSSDSGNTWDNVAVIDLHGGNTEESQIRGQRWEHTFTGLPVADYSGGTATAVDYDYRIRELQPKEGDYLLSDGDTINANIVGDTEPENVYNKGGSTYTTTYVEEPENHWTVTNTLDVYTPEEEVTQITAVKEWAVPEDDTTEKPDVTFQLQYRFAGDSSAKWGKRERLYQ